MNRQLKISFKKGGQYFFAVDSRKWDFVVYNIDDYELTDDEILPEDLVPLTYKEPTPTIQKLKSEAWSSNCRWFFVLQDEGIYLMNVYDNHFWLCRKHSHKFIQMYLNAEINNKL